MLRHEFQPGKLVAGIVLIGVGITYFGDARGAWETPWFLALPVICGGLVLAAVAAATGYGIRRRARRTASSENEEAPASSSGSQAIR